MKLPDTPVAAVDVEASGLHADDGACLASVAVAWLEAGEVRSLALPFDQGTRDKLPAAQLELAEETDPNLGEAEWAEFLEWCAGRHLIFHNAKYDLAMLKAGTRAWEGRDLSRAFYWDTMLAAGALEPREPRALGEVAKRAGLDGKEGREVIERWLKSHKYNKNRLDLAPWPVVEPYVTTDAELTIAVYEHQRGQVEREGIAELRREFDLCRVLFRMEQRGIPFDAPACLEAAGELERRVAALERKLPFEPKLNAAKRYFFEEVGLEPERHTDLGAPILDKEQMREWEATGVEFAAEWAQHSQASRALSMWYRGYPERIGWDGRLRTVYKQGHVRSGRMSVERVQLQAMPKADKIANGIPEVRSFVVAPRGKALWNLDLAQAELRVATKYARCDRMAAMLEKGVDIHGETTKQVLGADPDDSDWSLRRDIGKRLTFSAIFQIGGKHFQEILKAMTGIALPLAECEQYVRTWRTLYPEFQQAYYAALNKAQRDGWVPILPGSEFQAQGWFTQHDEVASAWNRTVQGSLAEAFKLWLLAIEGKWPGTMILTVHDSVVLELPARGSRKEAYAVAELGREMMSGLFGVDMPVEAKPWDASVLELETGEQSQGVDPQYLGVGGGGGRGG